MGGVPLGSGPQGGPRSSRVEAHLHDALVAALDDERSVAHVQSLARGLAVIKAFGAAQPEMTLSEVARGAVLPRATARRLLHTLVDLGYVRTDGRRFALRPRVLELGFAYLSSLNLPTLAQPHLEWLAAQVGESASISVLDGDDVVYIARVTTRRIMTVAISIGTRFPAYATSMGRVLLAYAEPEWLEEYLGRVELRPLTERTVTDTEALRALLGTVRVDGFAHVDQELELGLQSLAVAVRDSSGSVIAAMNLSAAAATAPAAIRDRLLPPLWQAADGLTADLAVGMRTGATTDGGPDHSDQPR